MNFNFHYSLHFCKPEEYNTSKLALILAISHPPSHSHHSVCAIIRPFRGSRRFDPSKHSDSNGPLSPKSSLHILLSFLSPSCKSVAKKIIPFPNSNHKSAINQYFLNYLHCNIPKSKKTSSFHCRRIFSNTIDFKIFTSRLMSKRVILLAT